MSYILLCQNIYSGELSTFDNKCFIFFKQIDLVLIDEVPFITSNFRITNVYSQTCLKGHIYITNHCL